MCSFALKMPVNKFGEGYLFTVLRAALRQARREMRYASRCDEAIDCRPTTLVHLVESTVTTLVHRLNHFVDMHYLLLSPSPSADSFVCDDTPELMRSIDRAPECHFFGYFFLSVWVCSESHQIFLSVRLIDMLVLMVAYFSTSNCAAILLICPVEYAFLIHH